MGTADVGKRNNEMRGVSIGTIRAQQLPVRCSGFRWVSWQMAVWGDLEEYKELFWRIIIYCVTYAAKTLLTIQS